MTCFASGTGRIHNSVRYLLPQLICLPTSHGSHKAAENGQIGKYHNWTHNTFITFDSERKECSKRRSEFGVVNLHIVRIGGVKCSRECKVKRKKHADESATSESSEAQHREQFFHEESTSIDCFITANGGYQSICEISHFQRNRRAAADGGVFSISQHFLLFAWGVASWHQAGQYRTVAIYSLCDFFIETKPMCTHECTKSHKYCTNHRSICVQNEWVHSMSSFFTYWMMMSEKVDLHNKSKLQEMIRGQRMNGHALRFHVWGNRTSCTTAIDSLFCSNGVSPVALWMSMSIPLARVNSSCLVSDGELTLIQRKVPAHGCHGRNKGSATSSKTVTESVKVIAIRRLIWLEHLTSSCH